MLRALTRDGRLLFGTSIVRLFVYCFLSVVLVLYLAQVNLSDQPLRSAKTGSASRRALSRWMGQLTRTEETKQRNILR